MPKLRDLNPDPLGDLGGTDLGIPFRMPDGNIGFVFGDTFGGNRPRVGGPNWRSPVLLVSDTHDVTQPIRFVRAARGGRQLWDYQHDNPVFSTVLPCDAISIGRRIYLWVMVTKGLGNEKWCEIWYSDDLGENWTNSNVRWSTSEFDGKRTMISWERGGDGFVYVVSTGGLARDKNMILWRVPEEKITNPGFWEGWGYNGRDWGWGRYPSDILPPGTKLGEICLRRIQGNWVLSGFDAGAYSMFLKVGADPLADWWKAPDYRPVKGAPHVRGGPDMVPRLYGCYVHPDSKFEPGKFGAIVSEWAARDEPYRAMQFRVEGIRAVAPIKNDEPDKEWDEMATPDEIKNVTVGETVAYDENYTYHNPDYKPEPKNLWGAVKRILHEATLWTAPLTGDELRARPADYHETTHGHARDAVAWSRDNNLQGRDLQVKCDKILRNQKKIADKLGVEIEE